MSAAVWRRILAAGGLLGVAMLAFAAPVGAAEMMVQGEVVDVVPLGGTRAEDCQPPQPARHAGLIELLEWDLRTTCPASTGATGYRVYYRWDGRVYSRVTTRPPGDTISLRVRLD